MRIVLPNAQQQKQDKHKISTVSILKMRRVELSCHHRIIDPGKRNGKCMSKYLTRSTSRTVSVNGLSMCNIPNPRATTYTD